MAIEKVIEILAKQQSELGIMRAKLYQKDGKIAELQTEVLMLSSGSFGANFYRKKYEAMRKSKARLEERIKRGNFSPWLSESQMIRIRRTSNRGLKWPIEDIRDGLILKMKCGTTGYNAFVQSSPFFRLCHAYKKVSNSLQVTPRSL